MVTVGGGAPDGDSRTWSSLLVIVAVVAACWRQYEVEKPVGVRRK